jgi:pimeloyl-ACP methyl ester carboxylesterase
MRESEAQVGPLRIRYFDNLITEPTATIVLLHDGAWGASADVTWGRTFQYLPVNLRVIAPDLLGFGGSDKVVFLDRSPYTFRAQAVFDLLDTIEVDGPVHLVGNSFGGSVALRALESKTLRSRLASVTTISGTGGPWRTELALRELATFDGTVADMGRIVDLVTGRFEGWDEHVAARLRWAKEPGHYQCMTAPHQRPPAPLQPVRPEDPFPSSLADTGIPTHLITGDVDPLVDPTWVDKLAAGLGEDVVITRVTGGHSPNLDAPKETWQVVEGFLRDVPGVR